VGKNANCPSRIVVIGGGYVGLHTAILAAKRAGSALIVDINEDVVRRINSGDPHLIHVKDHYIIENIGLLGDRIRATTNYEEAAGADVYIVAVQTPLVGGRIDYGPLRKVAESLADVVVRGSLVVSETTIYPGGTRELLAEPLARASNLSLDEELYVAHSPERINPGSREWTPEKIPRVVGGVGSESLARAVEFYRDCLGLTVYPVEDIRVAEASKLLENTFRFINISFVNELKRSFDRRGIDIREVIRAASTKPFGFMPFYPGPYVGGPCLPKDSKMLEEYTGSPTVRLAHFINAEQPLYYAARLLRIIRKHNAKKILFLGVGYKPDAYSAYESPPLKVLEVLRELDPTLTILKYDEKISELSDFENPTEAIEWADFIVKWGHSHIKIEDKPYINLAEL